MSGGRGAGESHSLGGPVDRPVLLTIRDVVNDQEPLATARLDDFLDPNVLEVAFNDGLCDAESARLDVRWTTRDDYAFHYTDSQDVSLRWGAHPHDGDYVHVRGIEHYHPPPDASSEPTAVEDSCIKHFRAKLVTRAVLKLWRTAYHEESLSLCNAGNNPP